MSITVEGSPAKNSKSGTVAILRDLSSQIGKSILMAVPPIRRWRLRSPRTSLHLDSIEDYLRENAFFGLNLLNEYAGGGLRGNRFAKSGRVIS